MQTLLTDPSGIGRHYGPRERTKSPKKHSIGVTGGRRVPPPRTGETDSAPRTAWAPCPQPGGRAVWIHRSVCGETYLKSFYFIFFSDSGTTGRDPTFLEKIAAAPRVQRLPTY